MIIISQNGKKIINFDNIQEIEINNYIDYHKWDTELGECLCSIDTYLFNDNHVQIILGVYKDEGRAKEVLNEIIKAYRNDRAVYKMLKK